MIITRTPFRVTLGGGGTDLPSYYEKYGGFIFSFALDKYMYISVNRSVVDDLIRLKYSRSESVEKLKDVQHDIGKACLKIMGINNSIEITSTADIPAGSGLGSSSTYTVGLLNALHTLNRDYVSLQELAESACRIEIDILKRPMGKQDQYLAAFGGFTVLEISKRGNVKVKKVRIRSSIADELKRNLLMFYTGQQRRNEKILGSQDKATRKQDEKVLESLHYIKQSGYKILEIVQKGNLIELGHMFDEHWQYKKQLAKGITNPEFDHIYETAKMNGAIGGKISGAGGGGFFTFYCEKNQNQLKTAMRELGLREMKFNFDYEGTKILANFLSYTSTT